MVARQLKDEPVKIRHELTFMNRFVPVPRYVYSQHMQITSGLWVRHQLWEVQLNRLALPHFCWSCEGLNLILKSFLLPMTIVNLSCPHSAPENFSMDSQYPVMPTSSPWGLDYFFNGSWDSQSTVQLSPCQAFESQFCYRFCRKRDPGWVNFLHFIP